MPETGLNGARPGLLLFTDRMVRMVAPVSDLFEIVKLWEAQDQQSFLLEHGGRVRALLTTGKERIDAALLDRLPNLAVIAAVGAGYEGVEVEAARARGIRIANAGDTHSGDVADHAVALALAFLQRIPFQDAWVRGGHWQGVFPSYRRALSAERFGIVGLGNIGRAIGKRLAPFEGEIQWWGPRPRADAAWPRAESLVALAGWCTTLLVACRGDGANNGLIDRTIVEAVGPDGLIVNIARGSVIDEDALIAALRDGRLGGAALDVFAQEPTPAARWADVPNAILSPHSGGMTDQAIDRLKAAAAQNLRSVITGEPLVNEIRE
jgi:lactate dehydrogenase-like 2-hydroxyacid dehydrogenase